MNRSIRARTPRAIDLVLVRFPFDRNKSEPIHLRPRYTATRFETFPSTRPTGGQRERLAQPPGASSDSATACSARRYSAWWSSESGLLRTSTTSVRRGSRTRTRISIGPSWMRTAGRLRSTTRRSWSNSSHSTSTVSRTDDADRVAARRWPTRWKHCVAGALGAAAPQAILRPGQPDTMLSDLAGTAVLVLDRRLLLGGRCRF
jgi:hypothetical protein